MKLRLVFLLVILLSLTVNCASGITISEIKVKPLAYSAHIYFNTDIDTVCYVEYSTNANMNNSFKTSISEEKRSHDIFLWDNSRSFLQDSTTYYYRIWAYNGTNNTNYVNSCIKSFNTLKSVTIYEVPNEGSIQDGIFNISHNGGTLILAENGHYKATNYPFGNYILIFSDNYPNFRTSNIKICGQNSTIDMMGKNYGFYSKFLPKITYNLTIEDLNIHNTSLYGVYTENANQLMLDGLEIYNCKSYGIYARYNSGSNIIVNNCKVYDCGDWGIDVSCNQNMVLSNNTVYNNSNYGGINYHNPIDVEIYNNTIYDCDDSGRFPARGLNGAGKNVSIYKNNITNCHRGIRIETGATNIDVHDNIVSNCKGYTVDVYPSTIMNLHDNLFNNGSMVATFPAKMANNNIYSNIFNNVLLGVDGDIIMGWVSNNSKIYGNIFSSKGALICYSEGIVVRNNIFKDGATLQMSNKVEKSSTNLTLTNNVFYNSTNAVIGNTACLNDSIIKNNIFMNISEWTINLKNYTNINVSYNCVWNCNNNSLFNIRDSNRISQNPFFVDVINGDFHLLEKSPCIDAGDPNDDYSNEPEPNGGQIDIGCYGNTKEAFVKQVNNLPLITFSEPINNSVFSEGQRIKILLNASDADNQTLNYTIKVDRSLLSTSSSYIWITNYSNSGNHTIEMAASDGTDTVKKINNIYINNYHPRWDVNKDKIVDFKDINIIAQKYGTTPKTPYPDWDVNQDGIINLDDLLIAESHFGENI